jgi:hypothetical protein
VRVRCRRNSQYPLLTLLAFPLLRIYRVFRLKTFVRSRASTRFRNSGRRLSRKNTHKLFVFWKHISDSAEDRSEPSEPPDPAGVCSGGKFVVSRGGQAYDVREPEVEIGNSGFIFGKADTSSGTSFNLAARAGRNSPEVLLHHDSAE